MAEQKKIPVRIGDLLKLGIKRFGKNGDPIMVYHNYVIFLKDLDKRGVELNKMFEVKIIKVFPKFAFAERVNGK